MTKKLKFFASELSPTFVRLMGDATKAEVAWRAFLEAPRLPNGAFLPEPPADFIALFAIGAPCGPGPGVVAVPGLEAVAASQAWHWANTLYGAQVLHQSV